MGGIIMSWQEILDILKECAHFELEEASYGLTGFGAINMCPECREMSVEHYRTVHYPHAVQKLESLPWTKIIKDPRSPKAGEYPTKNGTYITMMDCNEHEVCTNMFYDGHFGWMNKTHVKWWMPLPDISEIEHLIKH